MRARLVGRMETSRGRTCLEKTVCVVGKPPAPHNFQKPCHVLTPGGAELPDMTTNACCHHLPCVRGLFLWPGGLRTSTTNALAAMQGPQRLQMVASGTWHATTNTRLEVAHFSCLRKANSAFSIPCRIHKTMTPRQNAGLVCICGLQTSTHSQVAKHTLRAWQGV